MKKRTLAAVPAALMVLASASLAQAAPPSGDPTTLADGLVTPLHLAVGPGKAVTVSEEFVGRLTTVAGGDTTSLYEAPDWDVAGSDYRGSTLFFVESQGAGPEDPRPMVGSLKSIDSHGVVTTITDQLAQYEIDNNPDQDVQYGLSAEDAAANQECVSELDALGIPASYTGADVDVDSHVYAVAVAGNTAYVADAGANAVFSVNLRSGAISTLMVLPASMATITEEAAEALNVPSCAGLSYGFEGVPTDVEVGPGGRLFVSALPGGPEDASLGARGSVYRVNAATGAYSQYADGLITPTGIALDGAGNLYIASLFGPGIFMVPAGGGAAGLFLEAEGAANVEVSGSTLYATVGAFGNGTLISQRL